MLCGCQTDVNNKQTFKSYLSRDNYKNNYKKDKKG